MSILKIEAINPVRTDTWRSLHWVVRAARWELTCGFCRTRIERVTYFVSTNIVCPACGARNLLPAWPGWKDRSGGR